MGPNDPQALGIGTAAILPGPTGPGNVQITDEAYTLQQEDRLVIVAVVATTLTLCPEPLSGFPVTIVADGGVATVLGPIQGGAQTIQQGFIGTFVHSPESNEWSVNIGSAPGASTIIVNGAPGPGTPGPASTIDFVGAGVSTSIVLGVATVNIPGGGGGSTTSVVIDGLTTGAMAVGQVAAMTVPHVVGPAIGAAPGAAAQAVGVYTGTAGQVVYSGEADAVQLDGALPTAGQPLYLSATAAGKVTATAPSAVGQVEAQVGICIDPGVTPGVVARVIVGIQAVIDL